jgi:hypothetical protein
MVQGSNTDTLNLIAGAASGTLTVQGVNGCGQGTPASINVAILAAPVISAIVGDTAVCTGQLVQYIALLNGANTYLWTYPSGWAAADSSSDTLNITAGTLGGTISVQAGNQCGQGPATLFTVTTKAAPVAGNITGADTVCINASGVLTYNLLNEVGADSIYWALPVGWNVVSGQNTGSLVANNNGAGGTVTATVYNGCGNASTAPLNLTVVDTEIATITQSHDTLSTPANGLYQWYFNGTAITGATNQSYVALQNGSYTVAVTNGANCTGTSAGYVYSYLSVQNVADEDAIAIYPNPSANGTFQIQVSHPLPGSRLKVFDALGRQVFAQAIYNANTTLQLTTLSKGVYLVTIELNGSAVTRKLVIE